MFCRCGLLFGQHDENGENRGEKGRLRCRGFKHHQLPIPRCGPGCQNDGKCWDERKPR